MLFTIKNFSFYFIQNSCDGKFFMFTIRKRVPFQRYLLVYLREFYRDKYVRLTVKFHNKCW